MSLVLSFMVVWDFPTIARGMQSLRSSRLRAIYTEVAPTFTVFGALFGKALQAQAHARHRLCGYFLREMCVHLEHYM